MASKLVPGWAEDVSRLVKGDTNEHQRLRAKKRRPFRGGNQAEFEARSQRRTENGHAAQRLLRALDELPEGFDAEDIDT